MADPVVILEEGCVPFTVPPGHNPDYYRLPMALREQTSYEQWQWLSDAEKGTFQQSETEPDVEQ